MFSFVKKLLRRRIRLLSSIYGQVVLTITILSFFLFVAFGIIFSSVNEHYLNTIIWQNGNNMSSIVEGALYNSMLENDSSQLQNTIDIINGMPGIQDVNMYDSLDNLVYSSFTYDTIGHNNPNCKDCHNNLRRMFPRKEKSFKIVNVDSDCEMDEKGYSHRILLIKSPILNEKSCYTAACHEHYESDEVLGSIIVRIPLEELDTAIASSSSNFFFLAALTTFLLVVALMIFSRSKIRKPLKEITKASLAVSQGDKNTRLNIKGNQLSDIQMVSSAFNNMLDNLEVATNELQNWSRQLEYKVQKKSEEITEMQKEMVHVERIASLGKLSSSVAHEINNPLAGILTYAKLVQKHLNKPEIDCSQKESMLKYLGVIEKETKRCGEIVNSLLEFSRKDQHDFEVSHIHEALKEAHTLMSHKFKMANIIFYTDFAAESDIVHCSQNQIKQACIAILLNASEAVLENGEIIMKTSNPSDDEIRIDITDNGVGISPEDTPHIFEPFFSAKQKVNGTGLGLAIVHGIIQNHKGKIDVSSKLGEKTTFSITLPLQKN